MRKIALAAAVLAAASTLTLDAPPRLAHSEKWSPPGSAKAKRKRRAREKIAAV